MDIDCSQFYSKNSSNVFVHFKVTFMTDAKSPTQRLSRQMIKKKRNSLLFF